MRNFLASVRALIFWIKSLKYVFDDSITLEEMKKREKEELEEICGVVIK